MNPSVDMGGVVKIPSCNIDVDSNLSEPQARELAVEFGLRLRSLVGLDPAQNVEIHFNYRGQSLEVKV